MVLKGRFGRDSRRSTRHAIANRDAAFEEAYVAPPPLRLTPAPPPLRRPAAPTPCADAARFCATPLRCSDMSILAQKGGATWRSLKRPQVERPAGRSPKQRLSLRRSMARTSAPALGLHQAARLRSDSPTTSAVPRPPCIQAHIAAGSTRSRPQTGRQRRARVPLLARRKRPHTKGLPDGPPPTRLPRRLQKLTADDAPQLRARKQCFGARDHLL